MNRQEILDVLKTAANFELDENGHDYGSINNFPECNLDSEDSMTLGWYKSVHYPRMARLLESLPWDKVVRYPRNPQIYDEYPTEDGVYITMMDCDEHAIYTNTFKDGRFGWMNRTHIKWWMKLPEE